MLFPFSVQPLHTKHMHVYLYFLISKIKQIIVICVERHIDFISISAIDVNHLFWSNCKGTLCTANHSALISAVNFYFDGGATCQPLICSGLHTNEWFANFVSFLNKTEIFHLEIRSTHLNGMMSFCDTCTLFTLISYKRPHPFLLGWSFWYDYCCYCSSLNGELASFTSRVE